jgi:hypothetical protein
MEKAAHVIRRVVAAALVCLALLVAGCGVKVLPNNVPVVKNVETPPLNGTSLIVVNGEKSATEVPILNEKGQNLGFRANKQAWSRKLVESLAAELARRGANIRSTAPTTLTMTLPEIVFNQEKDRYQFKVKTLVASSAGWSKSYDGAAETGLGMFESADAMANRLAGLALADAVRAMLSDPEFLSQLSAKK